MVPLWKKNKNEVTAEEYNNFYKEKFFDLAGPAEGYPHLRRGYSDV